MKRVLFIAEPFYQYSAKIKQTIEDEFDYNVDLLLIVSGSVTNLSKKKHRVHLLDRHNSREFVDANRRTQEDFFRKHRNTEYDVILLLVFSGLCVDLFEDFVSAQKKAKKIIYLWDDVKRVAFFEDVKRCFDRIVSFDKKDCEEYGFEFLPLFFTYEYRYSGEEKKYISTYGTLNSDREQVL